MSCSVALGRQKTTLGKVGGRPEWFDKAAIATDKSGEVQLVTTPSKGRDLEQAHCEFLQSGIEIGEALGARAEAGEPDRIAQDGCRRRTGSGAGGSTMTAGELIDRLRGFDSHTEVYLQLQSRMFAPPVWIGLMDTAGLFDERKDIQLAISPWEPEGYLKPESDEQRVRRKALAELVAYDQELGLTDDKKRD